MIHQEIHDQPKVPNVQKCTAKKKMWWWPNSLKKKKIKFFFIFFSREGIYRPQVNNSAI